MKHTKLKNYPKPACVIAALTLAVTQASHGNVLLIDMFSGSDATGFADWSNAGVTEVITTAAVGTIGGDGTSIFNINGGLTYTATTDSGNFSANTYSGSTMLNSYRYADGPITVSFGNLGNLSNDTTGAYGGFANGNTFAIQPNQAYKLYLFGSGNADDQNTTFIFDGVSKSTSATIVGSATNADHFVTYNFTTPANVSAYTLDFTWGQEGTSNGAFNGLALVAIPEPSSLNLIGILGGLLVMRRRRA